MIRKLVAAGLFTGALLGPAPANAFLVVGTDAAQAPGSETRAVVLRETGRSVVAIAPTVRGPAKPLAVVVPLQAGAESTLHAMPITVFERTAKLTAPRIEEVWELDPCELHPDRDALVPPPPSHPPAPTGSGATPVTPAQEGDYEITVLGAAESQSAAKWLSEHGYKVPDGAESALTAAAKPGVVFAIARIDGAKLAFEKEEARLPPLGFVVNGGGPLPFGLASLGAKSPHDVVIDVLSPDARVEAANLVNLAVPTNLDAIEDALGNAGGLHRAVIDFALERMPGAALTEYAWLAASEGGGAPGSAFGADDLLALGADRLPSAEDGSQREVMVDVPESLARAPEGPPELKRAILACYDKTLHEMRGLAGDATVVVQTGDGGAVTSAKTKDASAEALGKCVEEAARTVKLDKPNASGSIQVKFALVSRAYLGHMVLSRLRARTTKGPGADLTLRTAAAIEGGREEGPAGEAGKKVYFAEHANNFRARYVVRHPWSGPIACADPKRGVWGAKPRNLPSPSSKPAAPGPTSTAVSAAPSGKPATLTAAERALAAMLEGGALPDLQPYAIAYRAADLPAPTTPTSAPASSAGPPPAASTTGSTTSGEGCGCRAENASPSPWAWLAISAIGAAITCFRRRNR